MCSGPDRRGLRGRRSCAQGREERLRQEETERAALGWRGNFRRKLSESRGYRTAPGSQEIA